MRVVTYKPNRYSHEIMKFLVVRINMNNALLDRVSK
jgi:hypothetical protein